MKQSRFFEETVQRQAVRLATADVDICTDLTILSALSADDIPAVFGKAPEGDEPPEGESLEAILAELDAVCVRLLRLLPRADTGHSERRCGSKGLKP